MLEPILHRRNKPTIFAHMLFANEPNRNSATITVGDRRTENLFTHKNPFGMVPKGAVTIIRHHLFGLIKPVVDRKIILD